jgi:hypothetical protein
VVILIITLLVVGVALIAVQIYGDLRAGRAWAGYLDCGTAMPGPCLTGNESGSAALRGLRDRLEAFRPHPGRRPWCCAIIWATVRNCY